MRQFLLLALGLLFVGTAANAAELLTVDHPDYQVDPIQRAPVQIYQNYDITTIGDTQVACGVSGLYTTQNWFLRRFFLSGDHGLNQIQVESVDFAVSFLTGNITVDVVLFTIPNGAAFTFNNMTECDRASVDLTPNDQGFFVNVPVSCCVEDGVATDLVVAIDAPSGELNFVSFYPGANGAGAFQDAYIAAADCGIADPIGVSDIGFPDSQTLFLVNGQDSCGPVATEESTWGQVKGLYR
jgi:hypothetical protein